MKKTAALIVLATLCLAAECNPTAPTYADGLAVTIDGKARTYDKVQVQNEVQGDRLILTGTGTADPIPNAVDDEYSETFRVEFDRAALALLVTGKAYPLAGTGEWNLGTSGRGFVEPDQVAFTPGPTHTAAAGHLFFYRACFCAGPLAGKQTWKGKVTFGAIEANRVAGEIVLEMVGHIPLAGMNEYKTEITFGFDQTWP